LAALKVTVEVPDVVGVPEINPVPQLTDSPAGSPVAPYLVGVLVPVIWYERALPAVPLVVVALVITGGVTTDAGLSATICIVQPLLAVPVAA
jgi:hypothetical protein